MEHFSYCVIPRISTQPHVLARRGLCWSPRDLKTSRGRGDWLKLETDCMNLGMLLLDLVTQHIFQYDILRHANWVIYIYTYFYIYIYIYIYTHPVATSNMPCPGCPIDCATHPHAARYICPIGLGVWGTVGLLMSCLVAFPFGGFAPEWLWLGAFGYGILPCQHLRHWNWVGQQNKF